MRILVIGVDGFIGSHLFNYLNKSEYDVSYLKRDDIELFPFRAKEFDFNFDVVINCAAYAHKKNSHEFGDFEKYLHFNYLGLKSICENYVSDKTRFIYLSSVNINFGIYDNNTIVKYFSEEFIKSFVSNYVILRLPAVYGPGVKANFSSLFKLVKKNIPLPFGAINSNRRSLISIYNLVDLIKVCTEHPKACNQTFLVSDGYDLSTTAMVKLMSDVQAVKPFLVPVPVWVLKLIGKLTGKSDMISRLTDSLHVDTTHTQNTLGWKPPFVVKEGFKKCTEKKKCID